jgi:hypothetical protein
MDGPIGRWLHDTLAVQVNRQRHVPHLSEAAPRLPDRRVHSPGAPVSIPTTIASAPDHPSTIAHMGPGLACGTSLAIDCGAKPSVPQWAGSSAAPITPNVIVPCIDASNPAVTARFGSTLPQTQSMRDSPYRST